MTHLIATFATEFKILESYGDNTGCEYVCMYVYNKMHTDIHTYSIFTYNKVQQVPKY